MILFSKPLGEIQSRCTLILTGGGAKSRRLYFKAWPPANTADAGRGGVAGAAKSSVTVPSRGRGTLLRLLLNTSLHSLRLQQCDTVFFLFCFFSSHRISLHIVSVFIHLLFILTLPILCSTPRIAPQVDSIMFLEKMATKLSSNIKKKNDLLCVVVLPSYE